MIRGGGGGGGGGPGVTSKGLELELSAVVLVPSVALAVSEPAADTEVAAGALAGHGWASMLPDWLAPFPS